MNTTAAVRRRALLPLLGLAAAAMAPGPVRAGGDFAGVGMPADHDVARMRIVPVRMMDDETLFLAAQNAREASMSPAQRLLNNRWLLADRERAHVGGAALRQVLKRALGDYWRARRRHVDLRQPSPYLPVVRPQRRSQFGELSNYRVRVSDDKFVVRFKYTFD